MTDNDHNTEAPTVTPNEIPGAIALGIMSRRPQLVRLAVLNIKSGALEVTQAQAAGILTLFAELMEISAEHEQRVEQLTARLNNAQSRLANAHHNLFLVSQEITDERDRNRDALGGTGDGK